MKINTTNYENAFIEVADDCPVTEAEVPPLKGDKKSVANLQFDLLIGHPYKYTSDDVLFSVFATRNAIPKSQLKEAREEFFSKGQPCMRTSPLTKRYGWGVHNNKEGKIAIYALGTKEYKDMVKDRSLMKVKAMRSKR